MKLFGYEFKREDEDNKLESFVAKTAEDGAINVEAGGVFGTYVDLEGSAKNDSELITKYREMALHPEVDIAIDDIVNEAIVPDFDEDTVELILDKVEMSDNVKKAILDEFSAILKLLDFNNLGYEIFRRWYVDGRLYYHAIIDNDNPSEGIKEMRYIDPRKIRKVREQARKRIKSNPQLTVNVPVKEYFIYSDVGFSRDANTTLVTNSTAGVKIASDSVIYVTSGLLNKTNDMVLSNLHKAIKPLNQLRTLEDATIIYKLSRSPDRRVFYLDVGNLPKMKAEQYVKDMMTKFKNKVVYDSENGSIRDDRKFMTMLEDFWLPRRDGSRGTEVTTLGGSTNFSDMSDVEYFQRNLYKALNVPISRLQSDTAFNIGRSTEISRDEVKFAKFIKRLRSKFSQLFINTLEKQIVLRGIMTLDDWLKIKNDVYVKFNEDNMFEELKETEILASRVNMLKEISEFVGVYYSSDYVKKKILRQSDEEIDEERKKIEDELKDPILHPPPQEEDGEPDDETGQEPNETK